MDLDIERYCALMAAKGRQLTVDSLRKSRVGVIYRSGGEENSRWSVFDCLVAEVREDERLYVLSGGTWYQVEGDFAERVSDAVEQRSAPAVRLPMARKDENERAYNERAAAERGLHLLDQCLAVPSGARTPVEFCDLLDGGRIVHVKRRSRSSTLSHLFSQGVVSAEAFLRDTSFRRDLVDTLRAKGREAAAGLIPCERPSPQDWEIVYAILGGSVGDGPRTLPFFSQLNFKIAAERLEGLSFRVSLTQVSTLATV